HPVCRVHWKSRKNPDGSWAAFTAIPAGPINPTNGHQFTNPNVNFGGEHFGVSYKVAPSVVRYFWLIDDGAGNLIRGGQVQVAAPAFNYFPVAGAAPARVQAVVEPPEPPEIPVVEFGKPIWVKEIRTTTHNNHEIHLRDLVSDDPDDDNDKNWQNGEPAEVEAEWELMQQEFSKLDGGAMGKLEAAPENLNNGDEVVTRRWEFYDYVGPIDDESKEAKASKVGPDDLHGEGVKRINGVDVDLSTVIVVGEYKGAQMAAVDAEAGVGLIDHLSDGVVNEPYAGRSIVISGSGIFTATTEGDLPTGMTFNDITGILSGTPTETGQFAFRVTVTDGGNPEVSKNFIFSIHAAGVEPPPVSIVDTVAEPVASGSTSGDGAFAPGSEVTVNAAPNPGFAFVSWSDNGRVISASPNLTMTLDVNHSLVAAFAPLAVGQHSVSVSAAPLAGGAVTGGGSYDDAVEVTVTATPNAGYRFVNWTEGGAEVSTSASYVFSVTADRVLLANFELIPSYQIGASAAPAEGGVISGAGDFIEGANVSLTATPNDGFLFVNWTEGGNEITAAPSLSFSATVARTLVANFRAAVPDMPFDPAAAGSFAGLVLDSASGSPAGKLSLRLNGRQGFSGWLTHSALGLRLRLRGSFATDGSFTGDFVSRGVTYTVNLQLVATQGGDGSYRLEGSFEENGNIHLLSLDRFGFDRRVNPAPYAGVYTGLFPSDPLGPGPGGDGYGLIRVLTSGVVRLVATAGDNTRFSSNGFVSEDGEWRLFVDLYRTRPRGSLGGTVTFRDVPGVSDFDGILSWDRPANPKARFYPDGFAVDVGFVGATYVAPARGGTILSEFDPLLDPNATWQIGGGDLVDPGVISLKWSANDRVTSQVVAPDRMRVGVNRRSGLVSGFYLNRAAGERLNFRGVAFQKQGLVDGLFPGKTETGNFVIEPAP
ncbi:MAG: putative Ig domain-containing protein, partial [Verrucomicrobiae bacterium]|nr:putative Ig domain-containing protein [Verrucomicrobiae bacterium]